MVDQNDLKLAAIQAVKEMTLENAGKIAKMATENAGRIEKMTTEIVGQFAAIQVAMEMTIENARMLENLGITIARMTSESVRQVVRIASDSSSSARDNDGDNTENHGEEKKSSEAPVWVKTMLPVSDDELQWAARESYRISPMLVPTHPCSIAETYHRFWNCEMEAHDATKSKLNITKGELDEEIMGHDETLKMLRKAEDELQKEKERSRQLEEEIARLRRSNGVSRRGRGSVSPERSESDGGRRKRSRHHY